MLPPLLCAALVVLVATLAAAQQITTPASLLQCLPAALTIQGGSAPYTVSVLPGTQVSAAPLEMLPPVSDAGSVTWVVDIPQGQQITFSVRDATGAIGYSAPVIILPGQSDSCIGANASSRSESLVPTTTATTVSDGASTGTETVTTTASPGRTTKAPANSPSNNATPAKTTETRSATGTPRSDASSGAAMGCAMNGSRIVVLTALGAAALALAA